MAQERTLSVPCEGLSCDRCQRTDATCYCCCHAKTWQEAIRRIAWRIKAMTDQLRD